MAAGKAGETRACPPRGASNNVMLHPADQTPTVQLKDLSLEQLGNVEVTAVSKAPEQVWRTAAAVYVITQDDRPERRRNGNTPSRNCSRLQNYSFFRASGHRAFAGKSPPPGPSLRPFRQAHEARTIDHRNPRSFTLSLVIPKLNPAGRPGHP
jgi:hypothetical protein